MNKVYSLLKINRHLKSQRIKLLGIYFLYKFKKRYIGIFLDPVLSCNLRCKMCYFSDEEKRKTLKGRFTINELYTIADAFFHRALKVQIGCGAEPSLFKQNKELILLAKEKKVPYVSMTTNGVLFTENELWGFVEAGLDEITLSLHGVKKETYEYLMQGASYEKFLQVLRVLTDIKKKFPQFKIRVNYTINKDNLEELNGFFNAFNAYHFDIIQLRPIQKMGNTEYDNFSWDDIYNKYDNTIAKVRSYCAKRNIMCIAPQKGDLIKEANENNSIAEYTYCNISPNAIWQSDFDINKDTYDTYAKRNNFGRMYLKNIFQKREKNTDKRSLNYDIS